MSMGVTVEPSIKHQLRVWFERALDKPGSRHCVLLWRLYMYSQVIFCVKYPSVVYDFSQLYVFLCLRMSPVNHL